MSFDFTPHLPPHAPPPAAKWSGYPAFNFVGGHIDAATVPTDALRAAADRALAREGATLATYKLQDGPLGHRGLREFVAGKLKSYAGIDAGADEILLTSGSLQAMDLVNHVLLQRGDTVIVEESNYGGAFTKLHKLGVEMIPVPLDDQGMRIDALEAALDDCRARGVRPKYIYAVVTVHNPTGTILPLDRRQALVALAQKRQIPIFEDECYSDLVWANARPPALRALDDQGLVIHIGTFSKTIAPALRVGYVNADWPILSRITAAKTDAGSGALEQMMLAEFCPDHFDNHVRAVNQALEAKLDALCAAVDEEFGASVDYARPPGGIFLWLRLPEGVETARLAEVAAPHGVSVNPGPEWSLGADAGRWIRICFANPPLEAIREGVARLAEICHAEFGLPERGANRLRGG